MTYTTWLYLCIRWMCHHRYIVGTRYSCNILFFIDDKIARGLSEKKNNENMEKGERYFRSSSSTCDTRLYRNTTAAAGGIITLFERYKSWRENRFSWLGLCVYCTGYTLKGIGTRFTIWISLWWKRSLKVVIINYSP